MHPLQQTVDSIAQNQQLSHFLDGVNSWCKKNANQIFCALMVKCLPLFVKTSKAGDSSAVSPRIFGEVPAVKFGVTIASWELTYPPKKGTFELMIFLFRWDMLVP